MIEFFKTWKGIASIVAATVTIVGGLQLFGVDVLRYRYTMAYENAETQEQHASDYQRLRSEFYEDKCERLKHEWYRAKESEEGYRVRGESVPQWLVEKLIHLEAELQEFGC